MTYAECTNCGRSTQRATDGACLVCGLNPCLICSANPHGDTHCWHWRGGPPSLRTQVQADCCWCGRVGVFGYLDLIPHGDVPISPSRGAVHGSARDWLEQPR